MNMFADRQTQFVFRLQLKVQSVNGNEFDATGEYFKPFGPWRMKVVLYKYFFRKDESLNKFLSLFFKYQKKSRPELFKDLEGFRLYACRDANSCNLVGHGS